MCINSHNVVLFMKRALHRLSPCMACLVKWIIASEASGWTHERLYGSLLRDNTLLAIVHFLLESFNLQCCFEEFVFFLYGSVRSLQHILGICIWCWKYTQKQRNTDAFKNQIFTSNNLCCSYFMWKCIANCKSLFHLLFCVCFQLSFFLVDKQMRWNLITDC